jgi:hypothetical protein
MRHGTRRRQSHDPLQPLLVASWLVVRDGCRQPLESRELPAGVDLRRILTQERAGRTTAGWNCEEIGRYCSFFFCERTGVRLQVGIERFHPDDPGPMHSDRADD